jgi:hypothetical protein
MNIFIWFIQTNKRKLIHLTRQTAVGYQLHKQQKYTTLKKMLIECASQETQNLQPREK